MAVGTLCIYKLTTYEYFLDRKMGRNYFENSEKNFLLETKEIEGTTESLEWGKHHVLQRFMRSVYPLKTLTNDIAF